MSPRLPAAEDFGSLVAFKPDHRARGDFGPSDAAQERKKPRAFMSKTAASASCEPRPPHALNALRDGASCSGKLW
jgi:hypothetical protein